MVQESWPENGPKIWATHRASASNLNRAHFLATKLWPENGLKIWTAFFNQKQTQNHELGRGLAHTSSARPSVESRQPDAPNHVENTNGPRMTNFHQNKTNRKTKMQKTFAAAASKILAGRTSQNCAPAEQETHSDRKNKRQPARAET